MWVQLQDENYIIKKGELDHTLIMLQAPKNFQPLDLQGLCQPKMSKNSSYNYELKAPKITQIVPKLITIHIANRIP